MESMDDSFTFHAYSCALCRNRVNLSESCCCKESEAGLFEVTETRLIKRANLQPGDKVCAKHYEKLKSGMIFGSKNACCAPFHVETSPGRRLRSVPRAWRAYFDSSDFSPRYMPSLQICDACYNITLDLLFDTTNGVQEEDCGSSDYLVTSPTSRYLNPRRWISTHSLHNMDTNSEGSSTWSFHTPRRGKSNQNLLTLYANRREKYGHPKVVSPSVRRYLMSGADAGDDVDRSSMKLSRQGSEADSQSVGSSFHEHSECGETPKGGKALFKRRSTRSLLLNVDELRNGEEESAGLSNEREAERQGKVGAVDVTERVVEKSANKVLAASVSMQGSNGSDEKEAHPEEQNHRSVNDFNGISNLEALPNEVNNSAGKRITIKSPEINSQSAVKCETHEYVSIPPNQTAPGELRNLDAPQDHSPVVNGDRLAKGSATSTLQVTPHVERLSHSLANEIVFFVLSYFSASRDRSQSQQSRERASAVDQPLQVFANTLALSIVNFVVDESRRQVGSDGSSDSLCLPSRAGLDNFGWSLADVIMTDVGVAVEELNACRACRGKILRHCESVVSFAHGEAERIMSTALETFKSPKLKLECDRLAEDIVEKAIAAALLAVKFQTKEEGDGNTEVEWIEDKQCYRTVFTIAVNDASKLDSVNAQKNDNGQVRSPTVSVDDSASVECQVDELVPVTRSLSNGFIDRIAGDESAGLESVGLRKAASNDSIFVMMCEAVESTKTPNGEEVLVKNLSTLPAPILANGFAKKDKPDVDALPPYGRDRNENVHVANGTLSSEEERFKDEEVPVEIVTFYPSSDEEPVSTSSSSSSQISDTPDSLSSRNETITSFERETIVEEKRFQEEAISEETAVCDEPLNEQKPAPHEDTITYVAQEETSVEKNNFVDEAIVEPTKGVEENAEKLSESPGRSRSFDKPTEDAGEQPAANRRRMGRELDDILPDLDRSLSRRRTMQFNRAVSDAEIVRNRCRSEMLPKPISRRSKKKREGNKEDAEPPDTSDVICSSIEDFTPPLFRRVPSRSDQESEERDSRSRLLWKAATLVGMLGIVFYAGWKYYYYA